MAHPGRWIKEGLFGKPAQLQQLPMFAPEQEQVQQQALQQGFGGLQGLMQPLDFEPYAQKARTEFGEQTVPGIAERFTAMGGQGSGAFGRAMTGAGAGLEEGLAGQESQFDLLQRGMQQQLLSQLLGIGLQPRFQQAETQGSPGFLTGGGGGLSSLLQLFKLLGGG